MSHDIDPDHLEPEPAPPGAARQPFRRLLEVLAAIGTVWIFFLMFLVVADVVGRKFLNHPITGVAEFAAQSVSGIVFLHLAAAIAAGRMTRSDFVIRLLAARSPATVRALEVVYALIGALVFAVLVTIAWPEWRSAWTSNEYFGVQGVYMIPTWPFRALLVVGSVTATLAYLMTLPELLRQPHATDGAAR